MKRLLSGKERTRLAGFIMSYERQLVGKGPKEVKVLCNSEYVVVKASGVLTTLEKSYLDRCNDTNAIDQLRKELLTASYCDYKQMLDTEFGLKLKEIRSKFDFDSDVWIIMFRLES